MKPTRPNHFIRPCPLAATLLLAFSSLLTLGADYPTTVLSFGPLAYWRFNETATSPALNKTANSSTMGSILDGYVVADAQLGEPGIVGNCVRLTNPGSTAPYAMGKIDVPYHPALNAPGAFSFELWMKPNSLGDAALGGGMAILSSMMNEPVASARSGYLVYVDATGQIEFRQGNPDGYVGIVNTGSSPLNAKVGEWRHVVCTFDGIFAGSKSRIYVNGQLVSTLVLPLSQLATLERNTRMPFRIGGTPFRGQLSADDIPWISFTGITGNRGFDGWVDEVAYYSYALGSNSVAAHFAAATANPEGYAALILADNPVGYWGFNEAAVTPPDPASLPIAANSGVLGSQAAGTNMWGVLAAQDGPPYAGFGPNNKAILNDGLSGGYLGLPNPVALNISGKITLMAWIKPRDWNYFRDIIAHGWFVPLSGAGPTDYQETFLRIGRGPEYGSPDGPFYEVGTTDGGSDTYYDAATFKMPPEDLGKWVFLAGTYDGANWNLYRNGSLVAVATNTHGAIAPTPPDRWSVGSRSDASAISGMYFPGWIDEPAIFSTALDAASIAAIYSAAQIPPVISRSVTAPAPIFKGYSLDLSVWAEGSPPLTYQWTSNSVSLGVTATNVTVNNVQPGTQTYSVIINNLYGSATSSVTVAVLDSAPYVAVPPKDVIRYAGRPFSFSVTALGNAPLSYQWKTNGTPIPGATSSSYTSVASPALVGAYTCTVTNERGGTNTSPVTLTVLPVPGGFAGAVLGSAPLAYWRLGESSGDVAHDYVAGIDGIYASATLSQPGYAPAIDPDTAVEFSGDNSFAGYISGTAINFEGTNTSFTLECWANGSEQADGAALIAKGTGTTGTVPNEQFCLEANQGNYHFFVRQANAVAFGTNASIGPNETWQHIVAVYDHASTNMYLYVNGDLSGSGVGPTNGLRKSSHPVNIGSKRSGNSPTYDNTFNGIIDEVAVYGYAMSAATVQAHYAAAYGPNLAPVIDIPPRPLTNYAGLPGKFSVTAHGTVPLSYQWKKDSVAIAGATRSVYTNTLALSDAGDYTVAITNGVNPGVVTAPVHLTVLSAPTSPPAIPGLVMHLPFNDDLIDVTGRGNNGVAIHVTTGAFGQSSNVDSSPIFISGQLGDALHFKTIDPDGFGTNLECFYATLGDRPDLHFSSNVNFTVAFWIRNSDAPAAEWGDLPFFCSATNSTFGAGLCFAWTYGKAPESYVGGWALSIFDRAGNGVGGRGEKFSIDDGNWHHLVHVFDRQAGNFNYLDGVAVKLNRQAGTTAAAAGNIDTSNWFTIGQDPTGRYKEAGSGTIDDLGVWKKALTPLEAASIFIAAVTNNFSFTNAPFSLSVTRSGTNAILRWDVGVLQSADVVTGPYTDVEGAMSPRTVPPTAARKFYRLRL